MTKSGASQVESASELISKRIAELGDWRGDTLGRMRALIREADPDVVEEVMRFQIRGVAAILSWIPPLLRFSV